MRMKDSTTFLLGVFCMAVLAVSCNNAPKTTEEAEAAHMLTGDELVKRGEYLVTSMGCHDCHSPKKPGTHGLELIPEVMLSGFQADNPPMVTDTSLTNKGFAIFYPDLTATAGPWGISYAANLTPDVTGIGTWTEEQFKKALTQGKFKGLDGARTLLPPMPWFNFSQLTDQDVKAIFAYLKSIPPVRNVVPAPVPPNEM
ncbi:c-type cytochrome [Maribellus sp. CM-23]|uniref:c-type cytochrome n=1 Tax=Maribellus sp. CM-23 TaxID=2781026 RepID=UPI001F2FF4A7|nr:c-type cytochrome [Maribellus sp. CM-23]